MSPPKQLGGLGVIDKVTVKLGNPEHMTYMLCHMAYIRSKAYQMSYQKYIILRLEILKAVGKQERNK